MPLKFDHVDEARRIEILFGWSRVLVTGVGWTFGGLFTYLQLRKYSLFGFVQPIEGQTLIHIALILYYYAWILAQPLEVQMSRTVYIADPNRGKIPVSLFFLIPMLVALGMLLFLVQDNESHLSMAFTAFFIIDLGFWLNIARLAPKFEAASAKIYESEHLDAQLAQLRYYVRSYLRGRWQCFRFATLALILLLIDISVNLDAVRQYVSIEINDLVPDISKQKALSLIPGSLFLSYIVIGESWVWTMRLRTRRALLIIDDLRSQYRFVPGGAGKKLDLKSGGRRGRKRKAIYEKVGG
jgi:hypothetical protein